MGFESLKAKLLIVLVKFYSGYYNNRKVPKVTVLSVAPGLDINQIPISLFKCRILLKTVREHNKRIVSLRKLELSV